MTAKVLLIEETELSDLVRRTADAVVSHFRDEAMKPPPEIMTKADAAEYLRCDVSKVNRFMTKGLPFHMFGSHPRFYKSDIDRWLKSGGGIQKVQGQTDNRQRQELV